LVDDARLGSGDPAQHRVAGLNAERSGGLTAHPEGLAGRCRRIAGRDDAFVIDAGERLVSEEPAERVSAQPAVRGELRNAESGRPDGQRARTHRTVGEHHRVRLDLNDDVGLEDGDTKFGQPLGDGPATWL
jgi:hypothetical protein